MSPIDHLPPEILSTIFLHVLPPFSAHENPERVPIVLGQVCRIWRTITLTLPGIWASLNITCNRHILHPPLDIIYAYLLRSAAHPLSIILNARFVDDIRLPDSLILPNPLFYAVLAAFVATRNRWRHISIVLASEATEKTLDMITQGDAPLLQRFDCTIDNYRPWQLVLPIPFRALQRWARLESLAWSCINLSREGPVLGHDSWPRLTTLFLEAPLPTSECLTLLQLSPWLSAAMFLQVGRLGDNTSSRHVTHTALESLHAGGAHITPLIDALTLPALVDLCFEIEPDLRPFAPQTALHPFLVRSAPPLHTLSITNMHASEPVLLCALALVGGLDTLIVKELGDRFVPTAALIHALHPAPPPGPLPLCPRLRTLHIGTFGTLDAPDGVLAAMLRARWGMEARKNGVKSLREVKINLHRNGHRRDRAEIRALDAEGMKVIL